MSFLFGGARPTNTNSLRGVQQEVKQNQRGVGREISKLELQQKTLKAELKKLVHDGRIEAATSKAKLLVRLQVQIKKLDSMRTHMTGLGHQIMEVQSTHKMHDVMVGTTRTMQNLNQRVTMPNMQKALVEYERQSALFSAKGEAMGDGLDEIFEIDGEREEIDGAIASVLKEAGLDLSLSSASVASESVGSGESSDELSARLQMIKSPPG